MCPGESSPLPSAAGGFFSPKASPMAVSSSVNLPMTALRASSPVRWTSLRLLCPLSMLEDNADEKIWSMDRSSSQKASIRSLSVLEEPLASGLLDCWTECCMLSSSNAMEVSTIDRLATHWAKLRDTSPPSSCGKHWRGRLHDASSWRTYCSVPECSLVRRRTFRPSMYFRMG